MAGNLIATTPKIDMHALAFQGIMVYTCFSQIRDMLRRKFGDDYVLLFAEPVENVADGKIDWYSPVQGKPQPLAGLPEEAQAPVIEKVSHMANEILSYADELIHSREPLKITRGNILKLALRYPGQDALFLVGQQPVYTCWGFGPGTPGAEAKYLTRLAPDTKKVAPTAQQLVKEAVEETAEKAVEPSAAEKPKSAPLSSSASAPFGWGWLWWIWPLCALALLILLLFSSFGTLPALSGITLWHLPGLPFDAEPEAPQTQIADLRSKVTDLQNRYYRHIDQCVPQKAPVQQALPAEPKSEVPVNPPLEELSIPKNAENTEFLEGIWHCRTGLANTKTGEPVQVTLKFDKNGVGMSTIYEKFGQCHGPARAKLNNGVLYIDVQEQVCPDDQKYVPMHIECDDANGSTICHGINPDKSTWDANFLKVQ